VFWPAATRADTTDRVSRTVTSSAGKSIRVDATIAAVTVVGSNRQDISIDVLRRAPSAEDFAKYPITIVDASDAVRIRVVQQDEGRDRNLKTDISIRVPSDAPLE